MKISHSYLLVPLLFSACASSPKFDIDNKTPASPQQVIANGTQFNGTAVVWGGVIANSENLQDYTQLEIIAYPLDWAQKPDTNSTASGRFILRSNGYLETGDYAPQRQVTIKGTLSDFHSGKIGKASYRYPIVTAEDIHLWPKTSDHGWPDWGMFSIGIHISN